MTQVIVILLALAIGVIAGPGEGGEVLVMCACL